MQAYVDKKFAILEINAEESRLRLTMIETKNVTIEGRLHQISKIMCITDARLARLMDDKIFAARREVMLDLRIDGWFIREVWTTAIEIDRDATLDWVVT